MIGNIIGGAVLLFLGSFAIETAVLIAKRLLQRRKAAALKQNTNDEKEVDQRNSLDP